MTQDVRATVQRSLAKNQGPLCVEAYPGLELRRSCIDTRIRQCLGTDQVLGGQVESYLEALWELGRSRGLAFGAYGAPACTSGTERQQLSREVSRDLSRNCKFAQEREVVSNTVTATSYLAIADVSFGSRGVWLPGSMACRYLLRHGRVTLL